MILPRGVKSDILLLITLILASVYLTGCSTTSNVVTGVKSSENDSGVTESVRVIDESKTLVETGMLTSIIKARELLKSHNLLDTEQGRELDYIAYSLVMLVYPYYGKSLEIVDPLKSSIYPEIVESVKKGIIPDISGKDASFFTLMITAAAVFHSSSSDVVSRSLEIAEQLGVFIEGNPYSSLVEGKVFELTGDTGGSIKKYTQALNSDEACYPAIIGIAGIKLKQKNYFQAERMLEKVLELYPEGKEAAVLLVESYIDSGNIEKASGLLEQILAYDPEDIDLALKRAHILALSRRFDQAEKLISIFENVKGESAESIYIRALLFIEKENYYTGEKYIEKGLKSFPGYLPLVILKGKLLVETGAFDNAEKYLLKYLKNSPEDPDLLDLLVVSYSKTGKWEKAVPVIENLLKNNSNAKYKRLAVKIYFNLDDVSTAEKYNADLLQSKDVTVEDFEYHYKILLSQGKKAKVFSDITKRLSNVENPSERSILYYYMSLSTDSIEQKLDFLQKSLFENLQNTRSILALVDIYEKKGDFRKAYRYLKQALLLDPENNDIKRHLGELERQLR